MQRSPLRALILVLGWASLLLASLTSAAPASTVKDVRLWAGPDATRLVFDLSAPVESNILTLQNPDRVVIDITGARIDSARAMPEGQGFVKQLRVGPQGKGGLRFVIDLSSPASPRSFTVAPAANYGHRLVVDLSPRASSGPPVVVKSADDAHGRDVIVAIDAGHGGVDPGSIGKAGTREKNVTLAIARRLKERIDKEPGMRAVLTRDTDHFVEHRERIARARRQRADMFVSVHADSYRDRSVVGSSVYVLSARGASDESARWLADRENAADLIGGVSLDDKDGVLASVLLDLSQGASMSASFDAAQKVMDELDRIGNVTRRGVKSAGFLVLKSPDIPSILVETAFISNPTEESRLGSSRHQERLAEAIFQGVRGYFYANPPPGTLVSELRSQSRDSTVVASAKPDDSAPSGTGQ
ncbi:MAG TPA: N-acetylmuramoyl-L-alanine amidase [Steroidobacteraceae bacterium]|nr:N-acetylmuramoyl-L-alanine amidase [Steroidobacteraceae bacterium]